METEIYPCINRLRMGNQVFNTKTLECMAAIQRRILDVAQQPIPIYPARVMDRLYATLFQRGGGSAEDMSSDREENLGPALRVANDVQPFVDTNTNTKTRFIRVSLELSSSNKLSDPRPRPLILYPSSRLYLFTYFEVHKHYQVQPCSRFITLGGTSAKS